MTMIILKLIGYMEFFFALLYVVALAYGRGEIVVPLFLKAVLYSGLLIAAGLGIVLIKRRLFLTNFYLYTFLVLDRILRSYEFLTTEKGGFNDAAELSRLYVWHGFIAVTILCFYLFVGGFLASRNVRELFHISQIRVILKHIGLAFLIYVLFISRIFYV